MIQQYRFVKSVYYLI